MTVRTRAFQSQDRGLTKEQAGVPKPGYTMWGWRGAVQAPGDALAYAVLQVEFILTTTGKL